MRLIKTEEEYEIALKRVEDLMTQKCFQDKEDELEILTLLISHYENKKYVIEKPTPVKAIKFRMEQMNLKQVDMIKYFGCRSKTSEVLSGKRQLTLSMIKKLHKGLGISAEILIQ